MDESQLITAVQLAAKVSASHPDYPDGRIRQELTDALRTVFVEPMKAAGAGYATQQALYSITPTRQYYRVPPRAIVAGLVTVQAMDPGGFVRTLDVLNARDQAELVTTPGEPSGYVDEGDQIRLSPPSSVSGWTLRAWYKIRPSILVPKQTKGRITAVSASPRQLIVNVLPDDYATGSPVAIVTGAVIDVVSPTGSHELHLVSNSVTGIAGTVLDIGGNDDLSRVAVGDYVRVEEQSEWPMLPPEFHRTLADAAAVVILSDMGMADKAAALLAKVKGDVERMAKLMEPRVRDQSKPVIPRYGPLRSYRRHRTPAARL